jgi:hypothetical protein
MKWIDEYLENIQTDPKCKVLHIIKDGRAVKIMKEVLFKDESEEANKWANNWTPYEKRNALLIVYSRKKIKNKEIIFQLLIGNKETGSVLGERFTYEKGLELLSKYK